MTKPLPTPNDRKVLVIGWDAADWRAIRPLLEQGKMPNLQKMMDEGVHGNNSTLNPVLSPMLWSSIGTGKRPYKHGIHGFSEPTPDGKSVRPITNVSRTSKAVWNMLNQTGKKCNVVAWWPSHPAEPIDGVMVSNWYQTARNIKNASLDPEIGKPRPESHGWDPKQWEMAPGTVHPPAMSKNLQEFRFHPLELDAEHVGPFIPKFMEIDQTKDKRLEGFAKTLADTVSVHGAATALMQLEPWDFMAVYYDGIDHFGHGFMKYHPPKQDNISDEDFEIYKGVVEGGYRFHDMMLGAMLHLAGEETTVILVSDHGFHPDHLRPEEIPAEPAGPAIEHRTYGIFVAKGPGIRKGEVIHGASVLDLTPTVLACFGLPIGADMDGKPLVNIFEDTPEIETIPSWDEVDGPHPHGMHPPDAHLDSNQSAEAIKQLVELGYIEEPSEDTNEAVRTTTRELKYNLAQAYMDGGQCGPAAELLEEIWGDWPYEHRFGLNYLACLVALDQWDERAVAIERFKINILNGVAWAKDEIERLRPLAAEYGVTLPMAKTNETEDGSEVELLEEKEVVESDVAEKAAKNQADMPKAMSMEIRKVMSLFRPMSEALFWIGIEQAIGSGHITEKMMNQIDKVVTSVEGRMYPEAHNMIGNLMLKMEQGDKARLSFQRALETDDENHAARLGLAEVDLIDGDWESATENALTATELLFQNPRAHYVLAKALEADGDDEHARIAYGVSIQQANSYLPPHEALLALLVRVGDETEAAAIRVKIKSIQDREVTESVIDDVDQASEQISANRTKRRAGLQSIASEGSEAVSADDQVTVVSGLPRSGTSMMMQMLQAGGIEPYTDANREADSDNPRGYFEHQNAIRLGSDKSWLPEARNLAVKIVAQLLADLPHGEKYRVIFMDRDLRDVVRSQKVMLDRLDRKGGNLSPGRMMMTLDGQVARVERLLARRPDIDALFVSYEDVVADSGKEARRISEFLGQDLDLEAMTNAVDGSLRRQKSESGG